jgi:hypothetical protein
MRPLKMRRSRKSLRPKLPKRVLLNLPERVTLSPNVLREFLKENSISLAETPMEVQTNTDAPDFEAAMQAFAETRKNYRNAFRELAK